MGALRLMGNAVLDGEFPIYPIRLIYPIRPIFPIVPKIPSLSAINKKRRPESRLKFCLIKAEGTGFECEA